MEDDKTVVLLDLWTDANRGDCALQLGLISMCRDRWPQHRIHGVFRFGANEMAAALDEVSFTVAALDSFSGGLRRTYYSARNHGRFPAPVAKLLSLWSFVGLCGYMVAWMLGLGFLLPAAKRKVLREITSADVVIWKGKNFRDYGGLGGINRQLTLLSAGFVATVLNANVHCVNASVWEMRNRAERGLLRAVFRRCRSISVREPASLLAIGSLGLKDVAVHFAQDLSFYHLARDHAARGSRRPGAGAAQTVAITVTRWGDAAAQDAYLDTLVRCLRVFADRGLRDFVVVPQVTRAAEDNADLVARLRSTVMAETGIDIRAAAGAPSITELLDVYEGCILVLGTRMHSCVFAMSVGTPFIAIAYDAGPKWDILKEFWPSEFVFTYAADGDSVASAAADLLARRDEVIAAAAARFAPLADASFDNVRAI